MLGEATRVLIADGDSTLRQQLYSRLLECDVFSDCVSGVDDALRKLEEHGYSVILLDIALPGGNVDELLARVAAAPPNVRPIVLILAGNPVAAGSLDVEIVQIVLRKPVALSLLTDLVVSCIRSAARTAVSEARAGEPSPSALPPRTAS
ncbi:MAG TPA: response regulator, partial [Thermoanaerobaculia bacterium]|nr:response regulator [Thermoanaerobaculia bacterium]